MLGLLLVALVIAFMATLAWILLYLPWQRARRAEADERAEEALREILSQEECQQLAVLGYLTVTSSAMEGRVYRIPLKAGFVEVHDSGKLTMRLCARPVQWLPDADVVVMHRLMIEGCEAEYLKRANSCSVPF